MKGIRLREIHSERISILERMGFQIIEENEYVSGIYSKKERLKKIPLGKLFYSGDIIFYKNDPNVFDHQQKIANNFGEEIQSRNQDSIWIWAGDKPKPYGKNLKKTRAI